jgi:hypothetical protein
MNNQGRKNVLYYKEVFIMRMKKLLQGALVVATVATTWAAVGATDADAATDLSKNTVGTGTIAINTANQTLTYTPAKSKGTDKEVLFGVATKATSRKDSKVTFKVAAWDVYDVGTDAITIDLSKLSNVKDNYIELRTDNDSTPAIIKIPAVAKATKATLDASTNVLTFQTGAAAKSLADYVGKLEYRTAVGSWADFADITGGKVEADTLVKGYQYQGATLYLRTPGAAVAEITETTETGDQNVYVDDQTAVVEKTYVTSSLPGKETKLTIAKQANGPKVTVSYTKATVTLKKDTEYRIWNATSTKLPTVDEYTKVTANGPATIADLLKKIGDDATSATLEVRTSANTKSKKCASKWTRVALAAPAEVANVTPGDTVSELKTSGTGANIKYSSDTDDAKTTDVVEYGGAGVVKAVVGDGDTSTITAEYKTKTTKVDTYTQVVLTNASDVAYDVIVVKANGAADTALKASTLAAKTTKGNGTVTLKNVEDGSAIYIRYKGVDKTKILTGVYTKLGVVDYPKAFELPKQDEEK